MNPVLHEILALQSVPGPDGRRYPLHSHVSQLECEVLQNWIASYQPRRVLEIGLAFGISSHFICDALQDLGRCDAYYIVDPFELSGFQDLGLYNLQRAGYGDMISFHREPSEVFLPQLWANGARFDFILIDGSHSFENVFIDYFYASRMLNQGGLLIFDDVHFTDVGRVVDHVLAGDQFQRLAFPQAYENDKVVRFRRLKGMEISRIAGFQKV